MTDASFSPAVTEQVVELRFTPNARVLDHRGEWAAHLSAQLSLPRWHIGRDRIDIVAEDESERAFVSHRNAGFITFEPQTRTFHSERAQKFVRLLLALEEFSAKPTVLRFGLRHRYVLDFDGSFEDLLTRVSTRYAGFGETTPQLFGPNMRVADVGLSVNLRDGPARLNTQCGPMREAEFPIHFKHRKTFPKVGLYVDLDSWQEPNAPLSADEIGRLISQAGDGNWARYQSLAKAVVGA